MDHIIQLIYRKKLILIYCQLFQQHDVQNYKKEWRLKNVRKSCKLEEKIWTDKYKSTEHNRIST